MTRLNWDALGERFYENGVDRGVLYINQFGVAWPGLISVSESSSGGDARPFYIDGVKYLNLHEAEEFEATLVAFSHPPEFGRCDGSVEIHNGLIATQQPRTQFGLSYRTLIGNDIDGPDHGYKIHLVYGALAGPAEREYQTLSDSPEPLQLSWDITTLPPRVSGMKPTAHFIIDSRKTPDGLLKDIESVLYGSSAGNAGLPTLPQLLALFSSYIPVGIRETEPGVWELYDGRGGTSHAYLSASLPPPSDDSVLWLDTSNGDYAIPKLIPGG